MTCTHGLNMDTPCVKCALANPAPEIQANGDQPAQTGTHAPSSLISEINAPVDPRGWAVDAVMREARVAVCAGRDVFPGPMADLLVRIRDAERARIRAIVMRLMGNEWSANQLLEEIGE